jgi:hypothetical protein
MTFRPLADHLSVLCFSHVFPPIWPYALLTDMLEEVNLPHTGIFRVQSHHVTIIHFLFSC